MANKYNLQIETVSTGGAGNVVNILGAAPAGRQRFICLIKISAAAADTVILAEGVDETTMTTNKDATRFPGASILVYPDKVDVDNPLFIIESGKCLNVQDGGAGGNHMVTVVYYDD